MAKVLEMNFQTETGRTKTIRVIDVRDDLTGSEVSACMDNIITKNIFTGTGGELTGKLKAQIVTTSTNDVVLS